MEPQRQRVRGDLLSLPQEVLQRILEATPGSPRKLRTTCKAFASAVGASGLVLRRAALSAKGARREVVEAFTAFPRARRVVINLQGGHGGAAPAGEHGGFARSCRSPRTCDQGVLSDSLAALEDRCVTSLGLLELSCAPPPALPVHLQASLLELEVSDASFHHAAEQGAFNLIVRGSAGVLSRTDAMVRLALTLPRLRRLSLAAAAFTAESVLALGALTQLQSLSIAGSLECPGGAAQAAAVHRSLLGSLPALRQLRLPLAVATGAASLTAGGGVGSDSDDEFEFAEDRGLWGNMARAGGGVINHQGANTDSAPAAATAPVRQPSGLAGVADLGGWAAGAAGVPLAVAAPSGRLNDGIRVGGGGSLLRPHKPHEQRAGGSDGTATTGFVFPPHLHDLTIPLCALNRPTFEAVCTAYRLGPAGNGNGQAPGGNAAKPHGATAGSETATAAPGGSLRSLHIPSLAGYSHWEGSFLTCDRDFELLAGLGGLEALHVSLELGAFRRSDPAGLRGCFQRLRALRGLRELRVTEAQQPACFSPRKRSCAARSASSAFSEPPPPSLSGPALAQLQRQWPQLQSLQFFSQSVVRCSGRLVVPGWEDVALLPAACACCSGPHLLAAAPRSRGRWAPGSMGRGGELAFAA